MNNHQIEDIYLLTPMQQGILFHTLLAPQADPYFVQTSYTISGGMNAGALEGAGQSVLERHPILRATPVWEGRVKPIQIVWRHVKLPFQFHDWSDLAPDEQERRFDSLLLEDVRRGFTLTQSPLMRHALVRLSGETYKYVLSHHHLLLDGWSSAAVIKEMLLTYEALARGGYVELEQPPPFRNYIEWLRQQDLEAAGAYWRLQLKGIRAPTPLGMRRQELNGIPTDSPETGGGDGFGEKRLLVSEAATARLREFARRQQVTSNTLTQCAWALLLSRYSGADDVVFGAVVSGRPAGLEGANEMVGLFINTLPVRISVRAGAGVGEWLRGAQAEAIEARRYEYSPLAEVQRWSEVTPGTPLFESVVVFENYPVDQMLQEQAGSMRISGVQGRERTGYPLTLIIGPAGDRLNLVAIYDEQRFEGALVESMLRHFEMLLANMAGDPERRVSDVMLLTEAERSHLLRDLNDTARSDPPPATIIELFRQQVRRRPDAVAIISGDERLTYAELDEQAEHLARGLRHVGVRPDFPVGVMMERSAGMIVALLGVLKAGGAYLPLDPAYPQARLEFMLKDSQVRVVLTQCHLLPTMPEHDAHVICLDGEVGDKTASGGGWQTVGPDGQLENIAFDEGWSLARELTGGDGAGEVTGDNLAYVIYTSGSTGTPKGVLSTHANATRLLEATRHWFDFDERDVWTLFHSYAFDFSVWEMWGALLYGGRLVVVPYLTSRSPEAFRELLLREGVTVLNQTPSAFRQFMQGEASRERADLPSLRLVIFGGEMLDFQSLRPWFARHGDEQPRLVNMYGITETTVHVTYRPVSGADAERPAGSMIGRQIPDLSLYILDRDRQLLPVGVSGEMYIGGAGLARGYLNRYGLTAERFLPDPFGGAPGARLYRTGDLARHVPGGDIEYLGRSDQQVQVRGHRVEPGEIEAVLGRHPSACEAVVLARDAAAGEKALVAYLVCHGQAKPTVTDLRLFAGASLPDYMVPSVYVFLESFPLTTNGKVDRKSLPEPDALRPELAGSFVAPAAPLESEVAEIWAEVLGLERVGVHDNFFDLGGHSLLLLQLHGKLRGKFQTEISLVELFEYPTVHAQAKRLSEREPSHEDAESRIEHAAQAARAGRNRLQQQRRHRAARVGA